MIVFDLVLATRRANITGVERYGLNLFEAVRSVRPDTVAFVHSAAGLEDRGDLIRVSSVYRGWLTLPSMIAKLGSPVEAVVFPTAPASPLFCLGRLQLCRIVHDVFPWVRARAMPIRGRLLYRDVENFMLRRYQPLMGTTQIVADDLRAVTGVQSVKHCGNAPGIDLTGSEAPVDGIPERFVLAVGTVEPRKNYERLLEMIESDVPDALPIVLVGRPGWGPIVEGIKELAARKPTRLIWLRDMAGDDGLRWLYRRASCLVSLSHAEGFNMPLVEGAASGRPVVCSDIPIHRAVAPLWARFVATDSDPALLWREVNLASVMRPDEREIEVYRRKYDWAEVAATLLAAIAPQARASADALPNAALARS